jgi:enamine deaminase RidA (YjgF/YER057c/UK114 family)
MLDKITFRSGPYKDFIAQAVRVGDFLHLSGQVGTNSDDAPGKDIVEQTQLAYCQIANVLAEFGATLDNVVDETMFVTDIAEVMENVEAVFGVRAEAYGGTPEVTNTLVQVVSLVEPELKIEIKCTAQF